MFFAYLLKIPKNWECFFLESISKHAILWNGTINRNSRYVLPSITDEILSYKIEPIQL